MSSDLEFEITVGGGCVPAGFYRATFEGVEATEHEEFGPGLRFIWEVIGGEHAGEKATRITSDKPTPKNAAGRMIAGLTGQTLKPRVRIDLAPSVGQEYLLQVEETPNGSTRVSTVMPAA
ncbi:MAG: hypothetical protein GX575_29485 [Candidatus Anammoximicrobium sp.]|nr:hypothetical protein [Candidatus Anammoximicrobium sp.]